MNEKSLCISCANNCADHAYELIKQLAEAGIYVQHVNNINYGCMCKVKKSMTYNNGILVRCSAYVKRKDDHV